MLILPCLSPAAAHAESVEFRLIEMVNAMSFHGPALSIGRSWLAKRHGHSPAAVQTPGHSCSGSFRRARPHHRRAAVGDRCVEEWAQAAVGIAFGAARDLLQKVDVAPERPRSWRNGRPEMIAGALAISLTTSLAVDVSYRTCSSLHVARAFECDIIGIFG